MLKHNRTISPLLVLLAVLFNVAVLLVTTLVIERENAIQAIQFGVALLAGNLVGNELYLRTPRKKPHIVSPDMNKPLYRFAARSSPLVPIRLLLGSRGHLQLILRQQLWRASRWIAFSRLNYPLLVIAIVLSSPIAVALIFSLVPIFSSFGFQIVLRRRHGSNSGSDRISFVRWVLTGVAILGAALVIVATSQAGLDGTITLPWHVFDFKTGFSLSYGVGIVLAILATVISALVLFANRWSDEAHAVSQEQHSDRSPLVASKPQLAIYTETHALRLIVPLASLCVLLLHVVTDSQQLSPTAIAVGLITGIMIRTPTQISLRTAYSYGEDPALPTIESSLPLISFVILGSLGLLEVSQWDTLVLGVIATTFGLALLQFEVDGYRRDYFGNNLGRENLSNLADSQADDRVMPRARHGFKALIISMFMFGTFIYYRPTDQPQRLLFRWTGDEYWGLLALSATGFFLLLAFRVSYIRNRIDAEEQTVARLLRRIELLQRFGIFDRSKDEGKELIQNLLALDRVKNPYQASDALETRTGTAVAIQSGNSVSQRVLVANYIRARDHFERAWLRFGQNGLASDDSRVAGRTSNDVAAETHELSAPDIVEIGSILSSVEQDFDTLTHSRQHGSSFGDFFSVGALGIATVLLAIGGLPQPANAESLESVAWESFLLEAFAILFCAVLVYLMFNLYDEITERRIPMYAGVAGGTANDSMARIVPPELAETYGIWFRSEDYGGVTTRRAVGALIALVVYASLIVILLAKWGLLGGASTPL